MSVTSALKALIFVLGFLVHKNAFNLTEPKHNRNILVRFSESAKKGQLDEVQAALIVTVVDAFSYPKNLKLVRVPHGRSFERTLTNLRNNPHVVYAEPDYFLNIDEPKLKEPKTADPKFTEQWYLHNEGQTGGLPDADMNALEAWRFIDPKQKVVIAVVDTGIALTHPELQNKLWVNTLEIPGNNKDDDHNGYIDDVHGLNAIDPTAKPDDDNGHGSFIAGIIGAEENNSEGGRGIVPNVSLIPCKFLSGTGAGLTSDAIECLNYLLALKIRAREPVNIVATNNSWGGGGEHSKALYDAIKAHQDAGILFVTVAAAHGINNDDDEIYPCNYQLDNILTAVATDSRDELSNFSSFGKKTVDVAAPGVDIFGTVTGSAYETMSGNSFATAALTGLIGLIAAFDPGLPFAKIRNLAIAGGTPLPALDGKTVSGRRIRAWDKNGIGSLSCHDQVVQRRLSPLKDHYVLARGQKLLISFININCAQPMGQTVEVFDPSGLVLTLHDNGQGVDQISKDGIYAAEWTAALLGDFELIFPNEERLTITVHEPEN
ncbi:MAG TPA: S8 family peptidase [Myxococcota bacterium]|nr:S8 family peptidase [Myxococcota bacterium]